MSNPRKSAPLLLYGSHGGLATSGQSMFTDSFLVLIVVVSILVYCRTMWSPTRQPTDRLPAGFLARPSSRPRIQRLPIPSILAPRRRCLIELFSSPGLVAKLIKFSSWAEPHTGPYIPCCWAQSTAICCWYVSIHHFADTTR